MTGIIELERDKDWDPTTLFTFKYHYISLPEAKKCKNDIPNNVIKRL